MTVIDLEKIKAVVEADGKVKCSNCVGGHNYWKGCDPKKEILLTQDDVKNPETLYICDYCEEEL